MRALLLSILFAACISTARADSHTMGVDSRGSRLPAPIGIGLNLYYQSQSYDPTRLIVSLSPGVLTALEGTAIDLTDMEGIAIENDVIEMNLKLDYWLLPFLNVFGILGRVDGKTDVDVASIPSLSDEYEYEGVVYGGGVTLSGGWKNYFAALTATLTETELDTSTSSVTAWILSPKVGMVCRYGAVWVGGMYQQTDEQHEGSRVVSGLGSVDYNVEFEQEESWNGSVGITTGISKNWQIDLEAGFGDRKHASLSTTFRF